MDVHFRLGLGIKIKFFSFVLEECLKENNKIPEYQECIIFLL